MQLSGSVDISAPRDRVWTFALDPRQVAPCAPGVESVEVVDPSHFRATAKVGVAFVSARVVVDLEIAQQKPPDSAVITAHGQAPGSSADATVRIALSGPAAGPTRLDWTADVHLAGRFAAIGAGMMEGVASRMIGQTLSCMQSRLEA